MPEDCVEKPAGSARPQLSRTWRLGAAAFVFAALQFRCATSSAPAPSGSAPSGGSARCRGTLGLEAGPATAAVRQKRGLPDDFRGAVVSEVLPGSPAAAAGIQVGDGIEQIGSQRLGNACEFTDHAFNLPCEGVRVLYRRGSGAVTEVRVAPADQTAYFAKACQDGNASACFRQGWLLWVRKGGPDNARALELFAEACRSGSMEACAYQGLDLMNSAERGAEALPVLEKSCDGASGGGCANLAFLYATGKLVKKDDKRAATLYGKSCDLGDPQGCYNAGVMADDGRGVAKDPRRAATRYEEGCALGSPTACTNLGYLYEHGSGVKVDKPRAFALYERGCEGSSCQPSNLGGCLNEGRAYRDGIGVAVDEPAAAKIFREACDRAVNPDDVHALENGARACSLLGALDLAGDGVAKDLARGLELSELGCGRGDSFGCFNAASVYAAGSGVPVDRAKAAEYLDLACKGGDGEGCFDLGVACEKGNGVAADKRRAAELYKKACDLGFKQGCGKKPR